MFDLFSVSTCWRARKRSSYKELVVPEVCYPPVSTYFSQRSHGGILEPTDCSCSPTLDCCDTHEHVHKHTHTHTLSTFTLTHGDTPPSFFFLTVHNHHSLCKIHTHHVPSAWVHFINTRTHTLPHMHAQTHTRTHFTEGPSPQCPSIWLVPFVPHVLSVADGKLLRAGGAVRPHDGSACPDLLKTYVTQHLPIIEAMLFKHRVL